MDPKVKAALIGAGGAVIGAVIAAVLTTGLVPGGFIRAPFEEDGFPESPCDVPESERKASQALADAAYDAFGRGDNAAGVRLATHALQVDPCNAEAVLMLRKSEVREELLAAAPTAIPTPAGTPSPTPTPPATAAAAVAAGRSALAAGDKSAAIEYLEEATALDPELDEAWVFLGLAEEAGPLPDTEAAIEAYGKAVDLAGPVAPLAYLQRGLLYASEGSCDAALPDLSAYLASGDREFIAEAAETASACEEAVEAATEE